MGEPIYSLELPPLPSFFKFNLAEAVNFALPNWLPFGLSCAQRYSEYKKMPVFSHDELIVTVATKDLGVENAFW